MFVGKENMMSVGDNFDDGNLDNNDVAPDFEDQPSKSTNLLLRFGLGGIVVMTLLLMLAAYIAYATCRIDVPAEHIAVLTRKIGKDLENHQEVAPDVEHKGLQLDVLTEGRYFYNPYSWDWEVYPMVKIERGKMGIRVRLYGEDLPYGHFVATSDQQKGIIREPLKPGRYAINALVIDRETNRVIGTPRPKQDYVEIVELWDPKIIAAGYRGVVTNLAGPMPDNPNVVLVAEDKRGPQVKTLNAGTYYLNPYMYRINAIDLRSQRFNLSGEGNEMGFPSKDGFWISLDGIIEFRVKDDRAAEVYVTYNDVDNDMTGASRIDEEIIAKVIMPNARSFCRLRGSNSSGRDFIGGETRIAFQKDFEKGIRDTCEKQGIEIVQALITRIKPPEAIRDPVRNREIAVQKLRQYQQQTLQQQQEAKLATEKALIEQKQSLVEAERTVIEEVTLAMQEQQVALEAANRDKEVAEQQLHAAKDKAVAVLAGKRAEAAVVAFANQADAAGWKKSVEALGNDGQAFARYVLYQKLSPGFKSIMTNTADSPLMSVFREFANEGPTRDGGESPSSR